MIDFNMSDTVARPVSEPVDPVSPPPENPATMPRNYLAILDWCERFRPEFVPVVKAERNNAGFIMVMHVGFESGRLFQKENPDYPFANEQVAPVYMPQGKEVPNVPTPTPEEPHN